MFNFTAMRVPLPVLLILFSSASLIAQVRIVKPVVTKPRSTNFGIGAGVTRSVVYLNRNVKANNEATGFHGAIVYGGARLVRVGVEYTYYRPLKIEPTWYDVNAHTVEANMHLIARFKDSKAYFYPVFGFSYNIFSGYFTGENDHLNLRSMYRKNSYVTSAWGGVNAGLGYEYFLRPASIYIDYKMRVGISEGTEQLNIMDVCISAGVRFNVKTRSIYRLFRGTRSRYMLDTRDND